MKLVLCLLCCFIPVFAQNTETAKPAEEGAVPFELPTQSLVVTASKKSEKKIEAPSTIEKVAEEALKSSGHTSYQQAFSRVRGLDFSYGGLTTPRVSMRGFADSFKFRTISLVDGRLTSMPGTGQPQGFAAPTNELDIQSMEVLVGPASALYGANATGGVLNLITKTPWDEKGVSLLQNLGDSSFRDTQVRYAGIKGNWAWKVTGQWLEGDDFEVNNYYLVNGNNQTNTPPEMLQQALQLGLAFPESALSERDSKNAKAEFHGYYRRGAHTFSVIAGKSENTAIVMSTLGRNRIDGFEVDHYQANWNWKSGFLRYTQTKNDSGDTFGIETVAIGLGQGLSFEQARQFAHLFDLSDMDDFEIQQQGELGKFEWIAGAGYRRFNPNSGGTYLDDFVVAGKRRDISRDETGIYFQGDYRMLDDRLRFTGALRYDDASEYDEELSPRMALTYHQGANQFRINYNQAYRSPEIIENHLFYFGGVARGNNDGYGIAALDGTPLGSIPALEPEQVRALEFGYRGVYFDGFAIDLVAHFSDYEDFISPVVPVADARLGTVAVTSSGEVLPYLLTYVNFGKARSRGLDAEFQYLTGSSGILTLNASYLSLSSFENETLIPDLFFNTPKHKYKAYWTQRDLFIRNSFIDLAARRIGGYDYQSGSWQGAVEAQTVFDATVGYQLPESNWNFKLSVQNLSDQDHPDQIGAPAFPRFASFEVRKSF